MTRLIIRLLTALILWQGPSLLFAQAEEPNPILKRFPVQLPNQYCGDRTGAKVKYKIKVEDFDPSIDYEPMLIHYTMEGGFILGGEETYDDSLWGYDLYFDLKPGQKEVEFEIQHGWVEGKLHPRCHYNGYIGSTYYTDIVTFQKWTGSTSVTSTSGEKIGTASEFTFKAYEIGQNQLRTPADPKVQLVAEVEITIKPMDCESCKTGTCPVGESTADVGSIDYRVSMGESASLSIKSKGVRPLILSGAPLSGLRRLYTSDSGTKRYFPYWGKDIRTLAVQTLINEFKYKIDLYDDGSFYTKYEPHFGYSSYHTTAPPFKTVIVENPDASYSDYDQVRITEKVGEVISRVYDYQYDSPTDTWTLERRYGESQTLESKVSVANAIESLTGDRLETRTTFDGENNVVAKVRKRFHDYAWGDELIEEVNDPDGVALTSTSTYYDNPAVPGSYRKLELQVEADGSWKRYEYDGDGRLSKLISPFLNAAPDSPENECRATYHSYSSTNPLTTRIEKVLGEEVARSYTARIGVESLDIVCTVPGAAWDAPENLVTRTRYKTLHNTLASPQYVKSPDGITTTYSGDYGVKTTPTSSTTSPIGTETMTIKGAYGKDTTTTRDLATNTIIESKEITETDLFNRPTRIEYLDGTYETFTYACCGVETHRNRMGETTTYGYDSRGNQNLVIAPNGVKTLTVFDALNRPVQTVRIGTDDSSIVQQTTVYDVAGRIVSTKDALDQETTFAETIGSEEETIRTTTNPDTGTDVTTTARDGAILSVSGTAVRPIAYEYGVESGQIFRKEIKVGGDDLEWIKSFQDAAGRETKAVYADDAEELSFYNAKGQLISRTDADGVRILYGYNVMGESEYTAIDMNDNGEIDFAGNDRIQRTMTTVGQRDGEDVIRTTVSIWKEAGTDKATVVQLTEKGLTSSKVWTTQSHLTTLQETLLDNEGYTLRSTLPDRSTTEVRVEEGQRISAIRKDANETQISGVTFAYDPHGRVESQTDARSGATTTGYDDLDRPITVTLPLAAEGATAQVTSTEYNWRDQPTIVTLPDTTEIEYEYFLTGELQKQSGSQTYTVEYTYDTQGRMKTMETATGLTTWNYDPERGWLESKEDAEEEGATYEYSLGGRQLTRTWARGVVTTYGYDDDGQLDLIDYSDATPDVSFERDRAGSLIGQTDGAGARVFARSANGQILEESVESGMLEGVKLRYGYDELLRRRSLHASLGARKTEHHIDYDAASRVAAVGDGRVRATYKYVPNSSLIGSITVRQGNNAMLRITKSWDNLKMWQPMEGRRPPFWKIGIESASTSNGPL